MAIGTGTGSVTVTDPLTNATSGSLFTIDSATWAQLKTTSAINIGPNGVSLGTPIGTAQEGAVRLGTTFPNDQYAQATCYSQSNFFGLLVRGSTASGGSGYLLLANNTSTTFYRLVNGTATLLGNGALIATGDKVLFQVVGNILRAWKTTGTTTKIIFQFYDSNITSGAPGLACGSASPSATWNTWQGGNAVIDPPVFPGYVAPAAPTGIAGLAGSFTANTWKTISVACDPAGMLGPPAAGTTGLILWWYSTGATTIRIGTRTTGSSFTTQPPAGTETSAASQQGIIFTGCKIVGSNAQFDMVLNSTGVGFNMGVAGYLGPETVWIDPPIVINPTGTMTTASPYTAQWSSTTPPIPGCQAVITDVWGMSASILPSTYGTGELTKWLVSGGIAHSMLCGFGTGWYAFTADNSSLAPTILVRGYMNSGVTWEYTAFDVSPTATGSFYPAESSAATAAGANILLYQAHGPPAMGVQDGFAGAVSAPWVVANQQSQLIASCVGGVRGYTAATTLVLGEQAYFVGVVPATGTTAPTSAKGVITIRSTSQTG